MPKGKKLNFSVVAEAASCNNQGIATSVYIVEEPPQYRLIRYYDYDPTRGYEEYSDDPEDYLNTYMLPLPWVYQCVVSYGTPRKHSYMDHSIRSTYISKAFMTFSQVTGWEDKAWPLILPNARGAGYFCAPRVNYSKMKVSKSKVLIDWLDSFWSSDFNRDANAWNCVKGESVAKAFSSKFAELKIPVSSPKSSPFKLFMDRWNHLSVEDVLSIDPKPDLAFCDIISDVKPSYQLSDLSFKLNFGPEYMYAKELISA